MTVAAGNIYINHVANGVTTVFPYPFEIAAASHLKVYHNGVQVTSGFTVSGVGSDGGGNVTYSVAPANLTEILFYSDMPYDRTVDYDVSGDFLESTLDGDQDYQTLQIKQLADGVRRSLRSPVGETADMTIAAAAARSSKFLAFDGGGNPIVSAGTGADAGLREDIASGAAGAVIKVATVAAMKALTGLVDGALVQRAGYTSAGDYQQPLARYVAGSSATVNAYNVFQPDTLPGRFIVDDHGYIDLGHAGAVLDSSTDNTTLITNVFTSLGSSYSGNIIIPFGCKYVFNTIAPLAPIRANIIDNSSINGWDSAGFRQKIIGFWEAGDPTSVVDLNVVYSSGHNASQILENTGSSGSASALRRAVAWIWGSGRFSNGQPGLRTMGQMEMQQSAFRTTLWNWVLRKRAPWAARNYEIWATGLAATNGVTYCKAANGAFYIAASTGTCGSTQPTHTTGTVSDGGVSWTFVELSFDNTIMSVDELGRISTNASTSGGYTTRLKQAAEDSESRLDTWEATGVSKTVTQKMVPTNSSAVAVASPFWQALTNGVVRMLNAGATITGVQFSGDTFDFGSVGHLEAAAANADTTPTVAGIGLLRLANTGATSITTLDDGAQRQMVALLAENGNTTLVHSASFQLKGAVNVTLAAFQVVVMKKYSGSSAWFEWSRNF